MYETNLLSQTVTPTRTPSLERDVLYGRPLDGYALQPFTSLWICTPWKKSWGRPWLHVYVER